MKEKTRRKARLDSKQRKFQVQTSRVIRHEPREMPKWAHFFVGDVMCPFCLHRAKISMFLKPTKKGFHKGLGLCRECQQQMQLKTLASEMTPEQFAEWVVEYPAGYFWKKCHFDIFNKRLKKIGWSYRFWGRYRELKPKKEVDDQYSQYLHDMEREEDYS